MESKFAPQITRSGRLMTHRQALSLEGAATADNTGQSPFGRPGAGAPLRSSSGKVVTSLRADPDTRFQTHLKKEVVDGMVRGNPTIQLYH